MKEDQLKAWAKKLDECKVFAIDTETDSLDTITANLVGISLSLKGQVQNSPAKMLILFLKAFQFLHLVRPHAAILFAPAVVRLLHNAHDLIAPIRGFPCPTRTSICRNLVTISAGFDRLFAICGPTSHNYTEGPLPWGKTMCGWPPFSGPV